MHRHERRTYRHPWRHMRDIHSPRLIVHICSLCDGIDRRLYESPHQYILDRRSWWRVCLPLVLRRLFALRATLPERSSSESSGVVLRGGIILLLVVSSGKGRGRGVWRDEAQDSAGGGYICFGGGVENCGDWRSIAPDFCPFVYRLWSDTWTHRCFFQFGSE